MPSRHAHSRHAHSHVSHPRLPCRWRHDGRIDLSVDTDGEPSSSPFFSYRALEPGWPSGQTCLAVVQLVRSSASSGTAPRRLRASRGSPCSASPLHERSIARTGGPPPGCRSCERFAYRPGVGISPMLSHVTIPSLDVTNVTRPRFRYFYARGWI